MANGRFERRLGSADVALLVIGSVIGSGIFRTPAVVALRLHSEYAILTAWVAGGIIALFGAFVLGELGARRPDGCGAYAYLREAFHPIVAFAYGWTAMLASFTGGLAAAAVLFAGYFVSLTGLRLAPSIVAVVALAALAAVNCFGLREGSRVQNALTTLKIVALLALVVAAAGVHGRVASPPAVAASWVGGAFALAMIPVLFTYNGAVVANFMAAEAKRVTHTLPRGLWLGMLAVAVLYVLVNAGAIRALGVDGLAHTAVPVADVLRAAAGPLGARLASLAVAITTLGFMSNRMLTVPRLYQAMAADGLFFRSVAWLDPRTRVPVVAIALQAVLGAVIALSGSYEHILNYVVSTFYVFNGLLALALFVLCARDRRATAQPPDFRVPCHPISSGIYMLASFGVALATCVAYPRDGLAGVAILLSAIPAYVLWTRCTAKASAA